MWFLGVFGSEFFIEWVEGRVVGLVGFVRIYLVDMLCEVVFRVRRFSIYRLKYSVISGEF